jgi:hypothetical protein
VAFAQEPGNYTMLRVLKSFQRSRQDDKMTRCNSRLVILSSCHWNTLRA